MARYAFDADQLDLGSPGSVSRSSQAVARWREAGTVRPDVPGSPVVLDPHRSAVAGFARGIRRLERGVPTFQALAAGRGLRTALRRVAAGAPGAGDLPIVRGFDDHPRAPARGRWPKKEREADEALGRSRG